MSTTRRGLQKGKATRTKAGVASPLNSTGIDGDIRVVETAKGPKLKVRSNGKWWTADLVDETQNQTAGFVPKVWVDKGITPAVGVTSYVYPPDYVTNNTIIGISFGISLGAYERTYFALGGTAVTGTDSGGDTITIPSTGSGPTAAIYNMFVHYNKKDKRIRIEIQPDATSVDLKDFTLAVFYEDRKS